MQKMQIPWHLIATRLTAAVRESPLSLPELARKANANYYAVRRIHRDGVHNRGRNALRLCKFFEIPLETEAPTTERELTAAVLDSWDGTPDHARLLIELMRCAGPFQVAPRQSEAIQGDGT